MMINKRLIGLCQESKKYIILTVLMNLIALICNIAVILMVGYFIDGLVGKGEFKGIYLLGIAVLLGGRFVSNLLYGKYSALASAHAKVKLRGEVYQKLLKLGMRYQEVESTSGVVQIMVEGVEQLEIYFGRYLPQFFYAMLAPITLFLVVVFISWRAAVVLLVAVPLIPVSIIAIMKIAKRILKNYWKSYSNLGGTFLENLQGLTTLKMFSQDGVRHEKMNKEAEDFRVMTMKVLSMQLNSINIMDLVAFGGSAAGIIVALLSFNKDNLLVGELIVIILLSAEFFIPMRLLGSYFHIAMNGMAASDRIFKLLDAPEKVDGELTQPDAPTTITVENVEFSYDGERQILKNISMEIPKGGLTAIVGESGSGKSTVASLLMKGHSPSAGSIKWDGTSIEQLSQETIYSHLNLVSTNSYIFNGTIRENLLMGNLKATAQEMTHALKLARLDAFVNRLKAGLDTPVGEGGSMLSGGQKQRLALARAILANREVMIFDEATSNIDVESEEAIWEAIYELAKVKTVIVISHRLANVRAAKNIYVMKKGEVVESGTHEALYSLKQEYYQMVQKQNELESIREVK